MTEKNNTDMDNSTRTHEETGTKTISRPEEPKMYKVLIHNDHYSTMDFVIEVLITVFNKPAAEATCLMLDVHKKGLGMCGVYTFDIAQSKIDQVHNMAKKRQFPLKCSCEET